MLRRLCAASVKTGIERSEKPSWQFVCAQMRNISKHVAIALWIETFLISIVII